MSETAFADAVGNESDFVVARTESEKITDSVVIDNIKLLKDLSDRVYKMYRACVKYGRGNRNWLKFKILSRRTLQTIKACRKYEEVYSVIVGRVDPQSIAYGYALFFKVGIEKGLSLLERRLKFKWYFDCFDYDD